MDFPLSVPSIGLVDGKFVDEDPLGGTPGSLIPAQWGNAVTEEILHVITTAGLVPDEEENTQLAAAISAIVGEARPLASQVEAEGGTDNSKVMTPLRTLQAILKRLPLNAPVVGATRNLRCSITAPSASAIFTADELVLKSSLGGLSYVLPAFNKPIDISGTGAGKMDTGAAPVSGYVAVYAIYNPDLPLSATNPTTLGRNATSAVAPEIYGGGSMPAGYTASALAAVLPTNGSGQFKAALLQDRIVIPEGVTVLSTTTSQGSFVSLNIAAGVPKNAKTVGANMLISGSVTGARLECGLASSGAPYNLGNQTVNAGYTTSGIGEKFSIVGVPLITEQVVYYFAAPSSGSLSGFIINLYGYSF